MVLLAISARLTVYHILSGIHNADQLKNFRSTKYDLSRCIFRQIACKRRAKWTHSTVQKWVPKERAINSA